MARRGTRIRTLAVLLSLLGPARVAAQPAASAMLPEGIEIRWSGASGCPDRGEVEAAIARRLAARSGEMRAVLVIVFVARAQGGYALDLTVQTAGSRHERRLEARDCGLLGRAVAVIVGVAVDPEVSSGQLLDTMDRVVEDASEGAPAAVPEPEPPVGTLDVSSAPSVVAGAKDQEAPGAATSVRISEIPEAPAEPIEEAAAPPRERIMVDGALAVRGGGAAGVLPGFGGGIGVALALTGVHWRVEGQFSHWFSRAHTFDAEPDVGADFNLWSAGVRACGVPTVSTVEIPLCAGGETGQIRAGGFGAPVNRTVRDLWGAAVIGPSIIWLPRPWVGLSAGVDGLLNLTRPGFRGEGRPELHRSTAVAVRVLLGIELRVGTRTLRERERGKKA